MSSPSPALCVLLSVFQTSSFTLTRVLFMCITKCMYTFVPYELSFQMFLSFFIVFLLKKEIIKSYISPAASALVQLIPVRETKLTVLGKFREQHE